MRPIVNMPQEDRATDMHKKIGKDRACGSGDILADRQTHRQTYSITTFCNRSRGRSKYHLVTAVPHFPVKTIDCRDLCARRDPRREHSILQYVTLTLMFTKSVTVSAAVSTGISCHQRTRATRCIMANVLQTKVDAQCDKLATDLS